MASINNLSDSEKRDIQKLLEPIRHQLVNIAVIPREDLLFYYTIEIPYEEDGNTPFVNKISKN